MPVPIAAGDSTGPRLAPATTVDEELMLRYADGDAAAFDTLYLRHKGALYRFLLRQCGNAATADELFQDVWLSVVRARTRYEPRARFTTYLFHLAHNRVIDHYRRQGRGLPRSYSSGEGDDALEVAGPATDRPDVRLEGEEFVARLIELLAGLPEAQREAFLLREEAGLSVAEIAFATGVESETAKSRLRYALAKLRAGLTEHG